MSVDLALVLKLAGFALGTFAAANHARVLWSIASKKRDAKSCIGDHLIAIGFLACATAAVVWTQNFAVIAAPSSAISLAGFLLKARVYPTQRS